MNFTLDQVSTDDAFNLARVYDLHDVNDNINSDSSNTLITNSCDYHSPDHFNKFAIDDAFASFSINIQSLTAHWDGLHDLICEMNQDINKIDVIGLTEIFYVHDTVNYNLPGYHSIVPKTRSDST